MSGPSDLPVTKTISLEEQNASDGTMVVPAQPVTPANSSYLLTDSNLREILLSDSGPEALLSRLKQSIHSCKEFAAYIKKAATIENDHSQQLKKAARGATDTFKRSDNRTGTFQTQILDIIKSTDRVGDAGNNFIDSMHRIHDELLELVRSIDRQRKTAKEVALRNERNLQEAETQAERARAKYDQSCEDLERSRQGDPSKGKLGFKNKSEDELHKKMTIAEVDYQNKVDTALRMRRELVSKLRVDSVKTLQSLILECDQALNLQVLRYANLLETLQLNRGFVIAPMKPKNSPTANLTVKEMACKMDSELDFYNYVLALPKTKASLNRPPITNRKHPSLSGGRYGGGGGPISAGSTNISAPSGFTVKTPSSNIAGPIIVNASRERKTSVASTASTIPSKSSIVGSGTAKTGPILAPRGGRPLETSPTQPNAMVSPAANTSVNDLTSSSNAVPVPPPVATPTIEVTDAAPEPPAQESPTRSTPVYGTPLEDLLDQEEGTVPRVVYQCVQAIDNFGLEVEGIYRTNGNSVQVQEIKREFDADSAAVDLLRPNAVVNDIHSVASALKQYFRELPDPLLTREFHREFINAANISDDIRRRDSIHAIINKLPDANYTTLRYLVFHLYRVQERESINRMNITNLGIVWGPTLMATDYSNVGEMAIQGRVVETVLANAYAIFEAE
ncbi:RHO GTPase-activating protein RGD1 [Wickerhamiella sorbophila]|uniref:RHO GTPase-activating protein RGD1 n=1 Tax=Wickerhamiella sorbophila TaxID=45607 RepID=A0A2T0FCQ1_9ASCO|nr:RHO GTPase-activating protein RGD1 [Wickerhamiella sorbophila]PRT52745.1 RHO GTPase-activating protein RGD1 [Wickerhamiella sorbophila]